MRMMNRNFISAALGLVGLVAAQSASAVMVDSFQYTLNGGFVQNSATCNDGGLNDCVTYSGDMLMINGNTTYSHITWGTNIGNGLSSLTSWQNDAATVGGVDTSEALGDTTGNGTIPTDGTQRVGTVFQHNNFTVADDDNLLTSVAFAEQFTIIGTTPGVSGPITPTVTGALFGIAFFETPNASGLCPAGQQSLIACDDFFVLLNEEDLFPVIEVCDNGDCWDYVFSIVSDGLTTVATASLPGTYGITLTPAQLAAAGSTVGVLVTTEGLVNQFDFKFSATHVPEPGILALLGLGALGLSFGRRKLKA